MLRVIIDEPYQFIPPRRGKFWPWLCQLFLSRHLRTVHGITGYECRGLDLLNDSLRAGHGILLAPNHCRPSDPMAMGILDIEADIYHYTMASWHVFKQDRWTSFLVRRLGGFSIYREGMDRAALNCSIEILETAERPLVVFPEGVISRCNDRLGVLMDGTAFLARAAAKKRAKAKPPGKTVIHPVALRYVFEGDLESSLTPVLSEIEHRLSWQPQSHLPLVERIAKIGAALVCLKEIEYLGRPQPGSLHDRVDRLIDHILEPLEQEWLDGPQPGVVVARVKNLRTAILPDLVDGDIGDSERDRRWRQLADCYLAQQLFNYPPGYITPDSPPERLVETVERYEEDLTDTVSLHEPLKLIIQIGEAIEVGPERVRGEQGDPVMQELEQRLTEMLEQLATEFAGPRPAD